MLKYLLSVLVLIVLALAWMYYGIGVPSIYREEGVLAASTPHFFNAPEQSVEKIQIRAFYVVPRDRVGRIASGWQETLESTLSKLAAFHALQFQNISTISYAIHPDPVMGLEESIFYDTEDTSGGNPHALIAAAEELEQRGLIPPRAPDDTYPVLFIMYEGVGAIGGIINESAEETAGGIAAELGIPEDMIFLLDVKSVDGFFLVNREIVDGTHGVNGKSIVAHEFYHTLGVPDGYLSPEETPTTSDIMGTGRFKPIEETYLHDEVLQGMGL